MSEERTKLIPSTGYAVGDRVVVIEGCDLGTVTHDQEAGGIIIVKLDRGTTWPFLAAEIKKHNDKD